MSEEYTGPRTCELCEYGKKLPCSNKDCNSANSLKDFKLRGTETEYPSDYCVTEFSFDGEFLVTLEHASSGNVEKVKVTAADIIGLLKR